MSRTLSTLLLASLLALPACGGTARNARPTIVKPPPPPPVPMADPKPQAEPVLSKPKASETSPAAGALPTAAPPPTAGLGVGPAAVTFTFTPERARPGQSITLTLSAPLSADVYFGGKMLAARAADDGRVLRVVLPKNARTGYLELRVNGRSFKADTELVIE